MKKICIVLALFTMFLFIGCGSDEDEGDTVTDTVTDTDSSSETDTDSGDSLPDIPDTSDSEETADNGDSVSDTENTDEGEPSDDSETTDEADSSDDSETPDEADSADNDENPDEDETSDEEDPADDEDQAAANPCDNVSCGNGGVCTAENGNAVCNCPDGFYDKNTACVAITSQKPGWIGVQWPFTISASVGETDFNTLAVFGRIYVEGVTGCPLSDHPQQSSWIAQLGYKKGTGSAEYPIIAGTWTWINAGFNNEFTCDDYNQNHEYMATFPTNEAGNFIYIFRFSLDNGATWWYADKGIGPDNSDLPRPDFITSETNHPGKATIN